LVVVVVVAQRSGQLESDGDADEHPETGLLGEQRSDCSYPFLRVRLTCRRADGLLVRGIEPAALRDRRVEDPLQGRSSPRHQVLRLAEPRRVADRADRGV
jgi:hypothetical protein